MAPDVRGSDGLQLHLRAHLYQKEMFAPLVQHRPLDGTSRDRAQGSAQPPPTRMQSRCCQSERARAQLVCARAGFGRRARAPHTKLKLSHATPRAARGQLRGSAACARRRGAARGAHCALRASEWTQVRTVVRDPVSNGRAVSNVTLCVALVPARPPRAPAPPARAPRRGSRGHELGLAQRQQAPRAARRGGCPHPAQQGGAGDAEATRPLDKNHFTPVLSKPTTSGPLALAPTVPPAARVPWGA